jgi:bile acid:Na+ symporter, BASS family
MMNVTGSFLSSWWHNRLPKEDAVQSQEEKPEINVAPIS